MLSTAGLSIYLSTTVVCLSFLQSSVHPQIVLRLLYSRNDFLYNTHDCKTSVLSLPFQRLFRNMHIALMTVVFHSFGFTCCNRFLYSFPVIMDGVSNRERIQKQSTVSSRLLILPFNCFLVKE